MPIQSVKYYEPIKDHLYPKEVIIINVSQILRHFNNPINVHSS